MPSIGSSRADARAANSHATALTWGRRLQDAPLVTLQDARDLLAEVCTSQPGTGQRIRRTRTFARTRRPLTGPSAAVWS
jgi:hypothetical protein